MKKIKFYQLIKKFMVKFKFLDHTADIRVKIFGKNEEILFTNAFLALNNYIFGDFKNMKFKNESFDKIIIFGKNLEDLLINFLNEILTLIYVKKNIYFRIKFLKFSFNELIALIFGQKSKKFLRDVKAVSYYNLKIKKTKKNFFEAMFVLDI